MTTATLAQPMALFWGRAISFVPTNIRQGSILQNPFENSHNF